MKFKNESIENSDMHAMEALHYNFNVLVLIICDVPLFIITNMV